MFWKRLPVTHAVGLWILLAAAALGAVLGYRSMFRGLRRGEVPAAPTVRPAPNAVIQDQAPTAFGTIVAAGDGRLTIDSKQAFKEILVDARTAITSVGGEARAASDLTPGAVITATGKDLGGGKLAAAAVVILDKR